MKWLFATKTTRGLGRNNANTPYHQRLEKIVQKLINVVNCPSDNYRKRDEGSARKARKEQRLFIKKVFLSMGLILALLIYAHLRFCLFRFFYVDGSFFSVDSSADSATYNHTDTDTQDWRSY